MTAEQLEPAHEIECPECGATIRARMADAPSGPIHTLVLPYPTPPLNSNHRRGRYAHAAMVRQLRQDAFVLAKQAKIGGPHDLVAVVLHWRPGHAGRYDEDNPQPTLKACADGLTDARVVVDDTVEHMTKRIRIHPPEKGRKAELWLTVQVLR